ncbi:MAG: citramalate synthase [Candidatus Aureabacteria bacterium]|nr:citramalate synthase [Candidatus Auribacterota bacterium]
MKTVKLYDTTLRDGTQAEGINFSSADKLLIARKLDEFGIHYIEGGWPGSNPKDIEFFQEVRSLKLKKSRVAAFGSTRRAGTAVAQDINVIRLREANTPVVTIFGKSWMLHVTDVLRTTADENLTMIGDTVRYFKKLGKEVIYDAEHFFDGYEDNPDYALKTLLAAAEAGADTIALCDTNGGTLPLRLAAIMREIAERVTTPLGIHAHNDSGMGVANSLVAVGEGAVHVQGTINGYGERCGNANLVSIIPGLVLKMGVSCIDRKRLSSLTELSRYVDEIANMAPDSRAPYVGTSAFAHKGGVHADAVLKNSRGYEHIEPGLVGNSRRILVSELSGRASVFMKSRDMRLGLKKDEPALKKVLAIIKELESEGYEFEAAEGSFKLLVEKAMERHTPFFDLEGFRVSVEKRRDGQLISEATIKVKVGGVFEHTAAEGDGPVNALDNALRKALTPFYPSIAEVQLADYKVRVLNVKAGTAARVRVLIESRDREEMWGTVGVSENIIEASWQALVDSVEYKLMKDKARPRAPRPK